MDEVAFDSHGRLTNTTSTGASPNFKVENSYYADGQRATKKYYELDGTNWLGIRTNTFVYDCWNPIAEVITEGSSIITNHYLWGLDLVGKKTGKYGQEAGGIGGLLAITRVSAGTTNIYFPISDHNGNIHHLVDIGGSIVATYTYSPFGVLVEEFGEAVDVCPFRFQSKYYDVEVELYNYGYRYYDPASCKWLSRDPLGETGGINLTAAFDNDPVNKWDASGLDAYSVPASYTHYWAVDTPSGILMFHYSGFSWNRGGISSYLRVLTHDRAEVSIGSTYGFMREYYPNQPPTDEAFRQVVWQHGETYRTSGLEDKAIAKEFQTYAKEQNRLWYNAMIRNCVTEGNRIFRRNIGQSTLLNPQGLWWDVLRNHPAMRDYTGSYGGGL